jgi:hypothetical protein
MVVGAVDVIGGVVLLPILTGATCRDHRSERAVSCAHGDGRDPSS